MCGFNNANTPARATGGAAVVTGVATLFMGVLQFLFKNPGMATQNGLRPPLGSDSGNSGEFLGDAIARLDQLLPDIVLERA
jgi:hypothetical protein